MLTHPALDQLRALKLGGTAQAFVDLEAQEDVRNLARRGNRLHIVSAC